MLAAVSAGWGGEGSVCAGGWHGRVLLAVYLLCTVNSRLSGDALCVVL
jgi:hypothetical protein